jgi:hypothetical protein
VLKLPPMTGAITGFAGMKSFQTASKTAASALLAMGAWVVSSGLA